MTTPIPGTTPRVWPPPQAANDAQAPKMQAPPAIGHVRTADFSYAPKPLNFTMDGVTYRCHPVLAPDDLEHLASIVSHDNMTGVTEESFTVKDMRVILASFATLFEVLLEPDSAEHFNDRLLKRNGAAPLDIQRQVIPVLHWLMEQHSLRPTRQAQDSSGGSPDETSGTSLTAGAPVEVSIHSSSPHPGS